MEKEKNKEINPYPLLSESGKEDSIVSDSGRLIDEFGGFSIELTPDRTRDDIANNRPGNHLKQKISDLPDSPGVYMYLDRHGKVIYVGKAKRLKRRVSSYFNRRHDATRTNLLVRNIVDLRFIVVASEEDALHLENAMIKEYQPRYNVLLKDDKSYPWIVVTNELFPRVFLTRDRSENGQYFGPYSNVGAAKTVIQLIREIYPLRSCRHNFTEEGIGKGKYSLCLDYHIHKCGGCCRGLMSVEEYSDRVNKVRQILRGDTIELEKRLNAQMMDLASELRFEEAQIVKMQFEAVKKYNSRSVVGAPETGDLDMFSYEEDGDSAFVNFMHLHHGAVVQSLNLEFRRRLAESREEILSLAISEIGRRFDREFKEVIVPFLPDVKFEGVSFIIPKRGDKKKLLNVGYKNLAQYIADKEKMAEKMDPERSVRKLMERMKIDFRLSVEPKHIECFDNSNIQGTNPVSSCVVFRNGKPAKRDYRLFNVKTVEGPDDFATMKEVLHRRYSRMMAEGDTLPQLVVVDGGKGQLSAAVEVFDELGIRGQVALIGIAKRLEEIYFPGDSFPLYIDKKSPSLRVIQALRDEAHRFGITHHRNRRSKSQITSELDKIKGVGEATKKTLLKHYKSVKKIKEASLDDLVTVVGKSRATLIFTHFHL